MRKLLIVNVVLMMYLFSSAQQLSFPQSFVGNWKGAIKWTVAGKQPQSFMMQLKIQAVDSGYYSWQISYGDQAQDNRPYILKPIDEAKGHWVIDEKNSILLDAFWIDERLHSIFSVQGTTIVNQYWLTKEGLHVEFVSYPSKPLQTTGGISADIPPVDSYQVKSIQRGILKREN